MQQPLSPIQLFQLYVASCDQAFFKCQFFAGDRAGDLTKVKTKSLLYLPRKEGLLFNHTLTKSFRQGTPNVFALKRHHDLRICPVTTIEAYVKLCDLMHIRIREGYLFRSTNQSGEVLPSPVEPAAIQARLTSYAAELPTIFGQRRPSLHGLRHGWAISLALVGVELPTIMDHVGWRTSATANHYIKLQQVLYPGGASEILSHIALDLGTCIDNRTKFPDLLKHFSRLRFYLVQALGLQLAHMLDREVTIPPP
jgi:integrase